MTREEELNLITTLANLGITPSKMSYVDNNKILPLLWKHHTIKKPSFRIFKDNSLAYFYPPNSSA